MRFLALCLLLFSSGAFGDYVDKSESVFFPPEIADLVKTYKSFPAFWWNFVTLEFGDNDEARATAVASEMCRRLGKDPAIAQIGCVGDLSRYADILRDWVRDLTLREPAPSADELKDALKAATARASLPMPRDVLDLLRLDPLGTYRDFIERLQSRLTVSFERKGGFFVDSAERRLAMPVRFAFPPSEEVKTAKVKESFSGWGFIGPHAATLENRARIMSDLENVSLIGTLVWVAFCGFLVFFRRWRLIAVFPPVLLGTALSMLTVIALFGKIHGLTLSFGTGIIGLTVDYGLHLAFSPDPRGVWRSNLAGFFTTMACLIVLAFSSVPILRELMIFAGAGFVYSYVCLYFFQRLFPKVLRAEPSRLTFTTSRWKAASVYVMAAGIVAASLVVKPELGLNAFNFQTPDTHRLSDWFGRRAGAPPLFQVTLGWNPYPMHEWARMRNIAVENAANYLPPHPVQRANQQSWRELCAELDLPDTENRLFAPFLHLVCHGLRDPSSHAYLEHMRAGDRWLTLWFPKNAAERADIVEMFPDARSLSEVVDILPRTLMTELALLGPLSILLVLLILVVYFRSTRLALLGLLPFFSGVGLIGWLAVAVHMPVSFVTLVGVVMLLGLSVDYAIFAIDHFRFHHGTEMADRGEAGAATALAYSSVTTIAGFLPLVFCKHQVLAHLGYTLTLGTLGTVLGAAWAIPALSKWIPSVKSSGSSSPA